MLVGRNVKFTAIAIAGFVLLAFSGYSIRVSAAEKPNVLLIIADDLGYADLGAFGGEIPTPNLDKLAHGGVRFTQFRAAPACSPSRAMLLTGADAHPAGLGNMKEELAPNQVGKPGYTGELSRQATTIGEYLQDAGYTTLLSGKWHLGESADALPSARGFDRTFSLISGGASHFSDMRPAYAKSPTAKAKYYSNGVALESLPAEFNYSSQYYVDWLISQLDTEDSQPFFAVLSFTAPHWPIQAPAETSINFAGAYNSGYQPVMEKRFAKQKQLGLIPPDAQLNKTRWKAWEKLSEHERAYSAKTMETYAAMVHELDLHTGRLIEFLRSSNRLENTVVVFLSDNGAEGHTYDETWPADMFPKIRENIDSRHDFSYANLGKAGSYAFYNAEWARVSAPSTRLHKGFPTDGGTRVPAFFHFPGKIVAKLDHSPVFIKDVVPTLLDLLKVSPTLKPDAVKITGLSLRPLLEHENSPALLQRVVVTELFGKVAVVDYPWKAVRLPAPWKATGAENWALHHLQLDNLEAVNLASEYPERLADLQDSWARYQRQYGVILPDWVSGY